jgi:hypothetical protein
VLAHRQPLTGEAWRAIALARLKTLPPIMEPTTRATDDISVSLEPHSASACIVSVMAATIYSKYFLYPYDHCLPALGNEP